MKLQRVSIRGEKFLVSKDLEIREDDYFATVGWGRGGYQQEVQRCKKLMEEEDQIMSHEQDLADPMGGGYFVFPMDQSVKIIGSTVDHLDLPNLTEEEIEEMSEEEIILKNEEQ